jgi:hypothetical protein
MDNLYTLRATRVSAEQHGVAVLTVRLIVLPIVLTTHKLLLAVIADEVIGMEANISHFHAFSSENGLIASTAN